MSNNDNIDKIALAFFSSLIVCSILNDSYSIINSILKNNYVKKRIDYCKKIYKVIISLSLCNYKKDNDGNIIIDNEMEDINKTSKNNTKSIKKENITKNSKDDSKKNIKEIITKNNDENIQIISTNPFDDNYKEDEYNIKNFMKNNKLDDIEIEYDKEKNEIIFNLDENDITNEAYIDFISKIHILKNSVNIQNDNEMEEDNQNEMEENNQNEIKENNQNEMKENNQNDNEMEEYKENLINKNEDLSINLLSKIKKSKKKDKDINIDKHLIIKKTNKKTNKKIMLV